MASIPLSYPVKSDADGTFEITFTALDTMITADQLAENTALYDAIANATDTAADCYF